MTRGTTTQILEATLRLIVRGGVHAVRYREVAAEANVSLGTVSYQYPSRDELLRAAFAHFLDRGAATIRTITTERKPRTAADIGAICAEIVRTDFEDIERPYLAEYELIVFAARDRELSDALARFDRGVTADLAGILETMDVPAPNAAAQTVVEMTRGFQLANLGQPTPPLEDFSARVARVVAALQPRGEPRRRSRRPA